MAAEVWIGLTGRSKPTLFAVPETDSTNPQRESLNKFKMAV
jgi:hypothetical protein